MPHRSRVLQVHRHVRRWERQHALDIQDTNSREDGT
jgi:hypothetical protein